MIGVTLPHQGRRFSRCRSYSVFVAASFRPDVGLELAAVDIAVRPVDGVRLLEIKKCPKKSPVSAALTEKKVLRE